MYTRISGKLCTWINQCPDLRHQQKSVDGYNRLPDVFTKEDVMRCFGYDKPRSALKKIARLRDSKHIEAVDKTDQFRKIIQMIV